jgi:phosphate starvation-inducible protein PhoH
MIITGDETQIDLHNKTFSGLKKLEKLYHLLMKFQY